MARIKITDAQRETRRVLEFFGSHPPIPPRSSGTFDFLNDAEKHALARAFDAFHLDVSDPFHHNYLLALLAYGVFGGDAPKGRPKGTGKWTEARRSQLKDHVRIVMRATKGGPLPKNIREIADAIHKQFKSEYADTTPGQIRQQILSLFRS